MLYQNLTLDHTVKVCSGYNVSYQCIVTPDVCHKACNKTEQKREGAAERRREWLPVAEKQET